MSKCKNCGTPKAYFNEVHPSVVENHTNIIAEKCYAVGIRVTDSWNVPAEDAEQVIKVDDITNLPVGAYLYNPTYGFFKITNWHPAKGEIGIANESIHGTAAPGTFVAADTLFVVTPKPCCEDDTSTLFPFLAEDYVIPNVSQERTIKVTSTFGLRLGDFVRIGSGVYMLTLINSSKEIVIKNEGAGGTPGDTMSALDADGEFQYLITPENASACSAPKVEEGRLIICDGANERILEGQYVGQVPVLQDTSTEVVKFEMLDAEVRVCSELVIGVNIVNGTSVYTFTVADASEFETEDIVQVNFGDLRFRVTGIVGNIIDVETTEVPGSSVGIAAGSIVCKVLTTETIVTDVNEVVDDLQEQIDDLQTEIDANELALANEVTARVNDVNTEEAARISADNTLQSNITSEGTVRASADTTLGTAITDEVAARAAADTTLQNQLNVRFGKLAQFQADITVDTVASNVQMLRTGDLAHVINTSIMPANGKVTHLTAVMSAELFGGSLTLTLFKNNSSTGKTLGFTTSDPGLKVSDIVDEDFSASHSLDVRYSHPDTIEFEPSEDTPGSVIVEIWGYFTP